MAVCCSLCDKALSSKSVYNRHLNLVHKQYDKNIVSHEFHKYNAKCFECQSSFITISVLREHLFQKHNVNPEKFECSFRSVDDFQIWLQNIFKEDDSSYVKEKGSFKRSCGKSITYFNCHRSKTSSISHAVADGHRKRLKKSQGSCKMNSLCTSQIKVTEQNGTFQVVYYKKHYNHERDIEHLPILKENRLRIANKLSLGVPSSKIFDDVIDDIKNERECLIRRKDINNIRHAFGINVFNEGRRHKSDAISVDLWVEEEFKKNENSSVLFYKPQGKSEEHFADNDFCLIFMTKSQQTMLERFGENIICIDSTHGLNKYDFELTTVLVVDEYCEGFPAACMFTNRKDTSIFSLFFKCIKEKIGYALNVKTVMTDITNVFINAWVNVMGPPKYFLYCSWHIDRAWQKNLNKIKDFEKRDWVYKSLKYLQDIEDEVEFCSDLSKTIELFCSDEDTLQFGNYFKNHYATNYENWALCFRKESGINTNMYIEAMHKVIKYTHLDGKVVSRLDKGSNAVLRYIKRKIVDRVQKNRKGKSTKKLSDIINRHRLALRSKLQVHCTANSNVYIVQNYDNNLEQYQVTKFSTEMCCKMCCSFCHICLHCFKCTCLDYVKRNTICKHIHFLLLHISDNTHRNTNNNTELTRNNNEIRTHLEYLSKHLEVNDGTKSSKLKSKISQQINEINDKLQYSSNENLLSQVCDYLKNANLLLNIETNSDNLHLNSEKSASINQVPVNKNVGRQLVFTSTKKKHINPTHKRTRNLLEKNAIKSILHNELYISNNTQNDHNYF